MFLRDNKFPLLRKTFVASFIIVSTFFNLSMADTAPEACELPTKGELGATVKFYDYTIYDSEGLRSKDFLLGGYLKNKYVGETTGVTDLSWASSWPAVIPP